MQQRFSLLQLNQVIQQLVESAFSQTFWVEAEVASANESRGHLYLELIEKAEGTNTPVAKASAKCWANVWMRQRQRFEQATGQPLKAGMKVLLSVYPQFHPAYGFSWIVSDIDPTFTVGDMARRRQEIIRTLKEEGVFDLQRQLRLPRFCQRIAVISSATAAGYGDFCRQLTDNEYGLAFVTRLFPAIMQGESVEESIVTQLNAIYDQRDSFDCVVIVRGGGATSDMSGFDSLLLAENVANFPLPVITGIGHDRDECILDMISHLRVKTPTAVAAFLVSHLAEVQEFLTNISNNLHRMVADRLEKERLKLTRIQSNLSPLVTLLLTREKHRLEMLQQRITAANPAILLQRGYSITTCGGRIVTDASQLTSGDVIETRFCQGTIASKVITPI